MLKEIVENDDNFNKAMASIKEINKLIDKAIKNKDQKTLDTLSKDLAKISANIK